MKNLLMILLSLNLIANELQWVDEQIEAIKPPREGVSQAKVSAVEDPFIFFNKKVKSKKTVSRAKKYIKYKKSTVSSSTKKNADIARLFSLDAIINESALINGKWYQLNAKIGKYALSNISKTTVTLSYKSNNVVLSTQSRKKNLKFKNN